MEANKVQLLRGIRLDLKPNDLLFTNPTTTAICQEFTDIKCISITTTAICQEFTDIKCISITTTTICQDFTDIKCISITTTAICQEFTDIKCISTNFLYHTFHFLYYFSLYMEIEFDR